MPINFCMGICMNGGRLLVPAASGNFTNIATNNAADGVYTLNGSTVAIGDIIDLDNPSNNLDTVTGIDAGGIHTIDNGGGSYSGVGFYLQPSLAASLFASGFTVLIEGFFSDVSGESGSLSFQSYQEQDVTYTSLDVVVAVGDPVSTFTDVLPLDSNEEFFARGISADPYVAPEGQISKIAMTVTDAKMVISINGQSIRTANAAGFDGTFTGIVMGVGGKAEVRLRSFAFYDVVDDADLPTLSAL